MSKKHFIYECVSIYILDGWGNVKYANLGIVL